MLDNRYAAFQDTDLPTRFRKAYEFCKEAHFRAQADDLAAKRHAPLFSQFHPVSMAKACRELNLPAFAIEAAILHDVIEKTPVDYDHIETVFDLEVSELIYEFSLNKHEVTNLDSLTNQQIATQLGQAGELAQTIKMLDMMQTVLYLGTSAPAKAQQYAMWACECSQGMTKVPQKLANRAQYICKWAKKRVYEEQVNRYMHSPIASTSQQPQVALAF